MYCSSTTLKAGLNHKEAFTALFVLSRKAHINSKNFIL